MEFHTALRILRRNSLLILLCVAVVTGVAYVGAKRETKQYSATAVLYFNDPGYAELIFGASGASPYTDPTRDAASDLDLVSLRTVATRTAHALGRRFTTDAVAGMITATAQGDSNNVSVQATSPTPRFAARVATTYARQFIAFRREAARAQLTTAQQVVQNQLQSLPADQQQSAVGLHHRADELQTLAALQTGDAELVQAAATPTSPSSPRPVRTAVIGFFLGLVLAALVVFLRERLDRRLRNVEEIEEIFQRPVLGSIPQSAALRTSKDESWRLPAREREAFMMLGTSLRYFDVKRKVETIMVTSAASGDGKTTISLNLVAATALGGRRALLVESDLRRPDLGRTLNLEQRAGLSDVLAGHVAWQDACVPVRVTAADDPLLDVQFDVLVAGVIPPNPTDLISSERMQDVLAQAADAYDLVVIDTPPTPIISDAIPLLSRVDGVIAVVRLAKTTRDAAHHLQRQLDRLSAPLLGIVINGITKTTGYGGYAYDYTYAASGADRLADANGSASPEQAAHRPITFE